jgi:hypothetical protein
LRVTLYSSVNATGDAKGGAITQDREWMNVRNIKLMITRQWSSFIYQFQATYVVIQYIIYAWAKPGHYLNANLFWAMFHMMKHGGPKCNHWNSRSERTEDNRLTEKEFDAYEDYYWKTLLYFLRKKNSSNVNPAIRWLLTIGDIMWFWAYVCQSSDDLETPLHADTQHFSEDNKQ